MLDLEDSAQYGLIHLSQQNLEAALRQAALVVEFASTVAGTSFSRMHGSTRPG